MKRRLINRSLKSVLKTDTPTRTSLFKKISFRKDTPLKKTQSCSSLVEKQKKIEPDSQDAFSKETTTLSCKSEAQKTETLSKCETSKSSSSFKKHFNWRSNKANQTLSPQNSKRILPEPNENLPIAEFTPTTFDDDIVSLEKSKTNENKTKKSQGSFFGTASRKKQENPNSSLSALDSSLKENKMGESNKKRATFSAKSTLDFILRRTAKPESTSLGAIENVIPREAFC